MIRCLYFHMNLFCTNSNEFVLFLLWKHEAQAWYDIWFNVQLVYNDNLRLIHFVIQIFCFVVFLNRDEYVFIYLHKNFEFSFFLLIIFFLNIIFIIKCDVYINFNLIEFQTGYKKSFSREYGLLLLTSKKLTDSCLRFFFYIMKCFVS